jgi:Zinc knuckle
VRPHSTLFKHPPPSSNSSSRPQPSPRPLLAIPTAPGPSPPKHSADDTLDVMKYVSDLNCFNCGKKGHVSKECDTGRRTYPIHLLVHLPIHFHFHFHQLPPLPYPGPHRRSRYGLWPYERLRSHLLQLRQDFKFNLKPTLQRALSDEVLMCEGSMTRNLIREQDGSYCQAKFGSTPAVLPKQCGHILIL